jgi:hypothetical protein
MPNIIMLTSCCQFLELPLPIYSTDPARKPDAGVGTSGLGMYVCKVKVGKLTLLQYV